jgi:hypothetical protein
VSRVGDIIGVGEGRQRLIARGLDASTVDEVLAFRAWMMRAADPTLEPTEADERYAQTAFGGRAYLEAVAPELLDA